ncbi:unnamed protein product, partial [marine sediment metagenome]
LFATLAVIVTLVIVAQESTLKARILPAAIAVVQPNKVESWDFCAPDIVGGAAAVIESASVGGKLA